MHVSGKHTIFRVTEKAEVDWKYDACSNRNNSEWYTPNLNPTLFNEHNNKLASSSNRPNYRMYYRWWDFEAFERVPGKFFEMISEPWLLYHGDLGDITASFYKRRNLMAAYRVLKMAYYWNYRTGLSSAYVIPKLTESHPLSALLCMIFPDFACKWGKNVTKSG